MMLVDRDIRAAIERGDIEIDPFNEENLGTNSYDVTLASTLRTYKRNVLSPKGKHPRLDAWCGEVIEELDCKKPTETFDHQIHWKNGFVLEPNELYLASTVEHTKSLRHVPMLNGKSSIGRLGLSIHVTAGFGDVGFCGHWTMELFVIRPLRIYAGMKIAQLAWFLPSSEPDVPYHLKSSAKYASQGQDPQASLNHLNFKSEG